MKKLTKRQEQTLKRHSKHHTKATLAKIKKELLKGKSFTEVHKNAPKKRSKK
tara:strand:- start:2742 stop:2897 length:156 start_codon:yes stop_codon:yes gene_type:complete